MGLTGPVGIKDSPAAGRIRAACVTCASQGRVFFTRYRDFVLAPGTLVTLAATLLLAVALIVDPGGLVGHGQTGGLHHPLYLAAGVLGSAWIWWSAIQGIRQRDFTADIPVSIATAAALAIGQYAAAAVVAVLLLVGGLLEEFVAARAGKAIEALAQLLPDRVTVRRGGQDVEIPLHEVVTGDLLLVRPGERIAVDGEVLAGSGPINQAVITGESMPVDKSPGDSVFAGSLNEAAALEVLATKVGEETTLGQIRRMVAEAEQRKAPIERLLDRWAKFYTPAALIFGGILWWWSGDILRAITMLIVFCPCVMVLATPTALVAAIGNAALRGSLVKQGSTIEALARVDTVGFDKTGTLTHGQPRLISIQPLDGQDSTKLLRIAAVAEHFSEHPLARAVQEAAAEAGLAIGDPDPAQFTMLPGLGVRSQQEDHEIVIGRPSLLQQDGIAVPPEADLLVQEASAAARTAVVVAQDAEIIGVLAFEDILRENAASVVEDLSRLGIHTLLVSGDNNAVAQRLASTIGIANVHAEILPQQKVSVVERQQTVGRSVAFVGDGVNDAPALAVADVGVAMGHSGTDVAIETAEIALLSDDLAKLPHLLDLSRQALRAIRQNLAFSLGVLAVAVVLTVIGILTPVTGALLHELSSIPVIANSARLINRRGTQSSQASREEQDTAHRILENTSRT
jgi:Cd2+/Zn2+-exporting ATPase